MALVAYSDSEGSDDEQQPQKPPPTENASIASVPKTNFAVDRSNPRRIRVNLQESAIPSSEDQSSEPAPKRQRVGGGAFSGFNAMLPAPKRDTQPQNGQKPSSRKVFSLKTGAEPGFSRESDAELHNLFAEQDNEMSSVNITIPASIPNSQATPAITTNGKPLMFKPLSVARGAKKKKTVDSIAKPLQDVDKPKPQSSTTNVYATSKEVPKKISLFSAGIDIPQIDDAEEEEEAPDQDAESEVVYDEEQLPTSTTSTVDQGPQSLDNIASDLRLSAADRRQLFGRAGKSSGTAINVVNFNTDQEYAANEVFRASGEQVQHNPVRAIASGKHSLKQLVSSATGQKEALEESFATGRRNKKEAGSKYGW